VARILNATFVVTSFGAFSSKDKYLVGEAMGKYVMNYQTEPLVLMVISTQ
jgi:hypothetical protein